MQERFHQRLLPVLFCAALVALSLSLSVAEPRFAASKTGGDVGEFHAVSRKKVPTLLRKRRTTKPLLAAATALPVSILPAVNQEGIGREHQFLANRTLRALPDGCRKNLKHFFVRYDNPAERGLGGKTTIILDGTVPDTEFTALLTHECGHVIHGNLTGSPDAKPSVFQDGQEVFTKDSPVVSFFAISWSDAATQKRGAQSADFISGYAKTDVFEDFAETFAAYALQRSYIEERAKDNAAIRAKLSWMERQFPLAPNAVGSTTYTSTVSIPWDITKLPFVLAKEG